MSYKPVPESRWRPRQRGERDAAQPSIARGRASFGRWRWRALLGLALVYAAIALDLYSPWAAVLVWWALTDVRRGETWFMERVTRAANPVAYWLLIGSWLGLSVLMVGLDFVSLKEP